MTHQGLTITAAALALVLSPLAAAAHHRGDHQGGNGGGRASEAREGLRADRAAEVEDEVVARTSPCANGLAAREPACVPPGLFRQGRVTTTEQWIGEPLTSFPPDQPLGAEQELGLIQNVDQLGLPALTDPDQVYVVAGGDIVVANVATAPDGTSTYTYVSTVRRAAFPGDSNG